ncbi:ATP-dependent Clp protease ATP-binding subunit [Saccharicrinis aurantiacus]|uniref:ATP-dependent Clp protease ATP-binding subunit n=1 Tax=Saccharicrinis aurantiacus TaxID=1849719 RepID=UPI00094FC14E|nr:ATP-dependent Clp protease ATP-binding subunit [Saccharicrinis aurantiacus]
MDFLNLNESVKTSVRIAQGIAREYGNSCYTPAHLLKAILHPEIGLQGFIESLEKDISYLEEWAEVRIDEVPKNASSAEIVPTPEIADIFEESDNVRLKWGLLEINPICVLTAISKPGVGFDADQLKSFPIRENEVFDLFMQGTQTNEAIANVMNEESSGGPKPMVSIAKYCIDKTALALDLKIHATVSRDKETRMMMEILGRHRKPNVLITGDSGVGKTALVDGLAYNIAHNNVPSYLEASIIYELDTGALIAGATYKGEIEDRLKGLIKEINQVDRAILFIDEIQTLLDPKQGNSGAAGILKPELSKGNLTVIGVTTVDEYRKLIEPDHAFSRRFEVLQIDEPNSTDAIKMVNSVLKHYTNYHKLAVTNEAISSCVHMAKRYVKDRRLPDSAIDLLDRTMSAVKMVNETAKSDVLDLTKQIAEIEGDHATPEEQRAEALKMVHLSMQNKLSPVLLGVLTQEKDTNEIESFTDWYNYLTESVEVIGNFVKDKIEEVAAHEVAAIISNKTGIPIGKIQSGEKERLLNMEELLRRRVVGQDDALKSLVDAILESRSGMNKPGQPIGSFFLLGPTGTGKTELAKALAEILFNDEKAMIRFDMSEFKEEHSAALLYGAPPGYVGYEEGGMLVNKIRQQPYAVVLFDEIEKAHASVYDIFLQIMDEGKLHDRLGKEGDFSNAIILFTSNVGSQWLIEQKEAGKNPSTTQIMDVMGEYFRPEYLARLSEIVPFSPISEDILLKIFDIQFKSIVNVLESKGINIEVSEAAKRMLAHKGFTPKYGARQVNGIIRNYLRRPISKFLISNKITKNDTLYVALDANNELSWHINELPPAIEAAGTESEAENKDILITNP